MGGKRAPLRRLRQPAAVEAKLVENGEASPKREDIVAPAHPEMPKQFAAQAERKRDRSTGSCGLRSSS